MCASYMIKGDIHRLARLYGFETDIEPGEHTDRILPHRLGYVVVKNGSLKIKPMSFSLIPSWSKERKPKFATHNARLESIDTKPTWRGPFIKNHCLVPMNGFFEPIYEGEHAGHMVRFGRKDGDYMFAAGLYDQWVSKETGEVVDSFSVITNDPIPFVAQVGHDRTPLFLKRSAWEPWLGQTDKKGPELKVWLTANVDEMEMEVQRDRPMRPGWEKRK